MDFSFTYLLDGLWTACSPINIFWAAVGCLVGTLVGVLPGIGPTSGIAILLPLTAKLGDPTGSIIMLAAIYYGAMYGGSTTAIMVNIPGEASSVCTAIDGFQLAKQGRGGPTLAICAISSWVAGTLGVIGLSFFAPPLASLALKFGPPEYFSLMFMALALIISLAGRALLKGLIAASFGLLISYIGQNPLTGTSRLTFGSLDLMGGIDFISVIIGLFAISEVFSNVEKHTRYMLAHSKVDWKPKWAEVLYCRFAMLRASVVGFFLGLLPGCAPAVTTFIAYDVEKRFSKHPEKFGNGAIDGVAAVEAANNATSSACLLYTSPSPRDSH